MRRDALLRTLLLLAGAAGALACGGAHLADDTGVRYRAILDSQAAGTRGGEIAPLDAADAAVILARHRGLKEPKQATAVTGMQQNPTAQVVPLLITPGVPAAGEGRIRLEAK